MNWFIFATVWLGSGYIFHGMAIKSWNKRWKGYPALGDSSVGRVVGALLGPAMFGAVLAEWTS